MLAPNPRLQRTRAALLLKSVLGERSSSGGNRRAPRSRQPLGRGKIWLLALCVVGVACSERLTPSRAATVIRHSKAFLSGPPESQPVFDRVSALLSGSQGGTPERQEGDSCVAVFSYHWPADPKPDGAGRALAELEARVVLRRTGNSWAVDDHLSRLLVPSWPQLPRTANPFSSSARSAP